MSNKILKILLLTIIGSLYGGRALDQFEKLIKRRPLDSNEAAIAYFDIPENEQEDALKLLIKQHIVLPGLEKPIMELKAKLEGKAEKEEMEIAKESGVHEVAARKFEANEAEIHKLTEELNELIDKSDSYGMFKTNMNMQKDIRKLKSSNLTLAEDISDLNNQVEEKSKSSDVRTQRALQFQKLGIKNLTNAKDQLEKEKEELQKKINSLK